MVDQVKIISARRAYEFHVDALRLTTLSIAGVPDAIQKHFHFQTLEVATPRPTFGPVQTTMPPGLVYTLGSVQTSDGPFAAIRFMHFEPQRIIIDVAGPSCAIDRVYEQLQGLLEGVRALDGSPAIGEPIRALDYSEISIRLSFDIEKLISEPLLASAQRMLANDKNDKVIPATIVLQAANPHNDIVEPTWGQAILQIRAGSKMGERVYFCNADLPTEKNIAWLEDLDRELGHDRESSCEARPPKKSD